MDPFGFNPSDHEEIGSTPYLRVRWGSTGDPTARDGKTVFEVGKPSHDVGIVKSIKCYDYDDEDDGTGGVYHITGDAGDVAIGAGLVESTTP